MPSTARPSPRRAAAAWPRWIASAGWKRRLTTPRRGPMRRPRRPAPTDAPRTARDDAASFAGDDVEREVLEFDVQFVGAGPAGLAGAIHLADLVARHNAAAAAAGTAPLPELNLAVLEKSAEVGAHGISGAVVD